LTLILYIEYYTKLRCDYQQVTRKQAKPTHNVNGELIVKRISWTITAALAARDLANKAALETKNGAIVKANAVYGAFIESIGYGVLVP